MMEMRERKQRVSMQKRLLVNWNKVYQKAGRLPTKWKNV